MRSQKTNRNTYPDIRNIILMALFLTGCQQGQSSPDKEPPVVDTPDTPAPPEISFTPSRLSTWSEHSAAVDLVATDDRGIAAGPDVTCDQDGIFSDNVFTAPLTSDALSVTCTAEVTDTDGNVSTATLEVDVQVPQARALDTWHGTVTPSFEQASPQSYEQFANSPNLNITGGPAGLNHTPTDAPGAGKFVFNRVFRSQKHGLGYGEQFGIFSSWLHAFGANSIEGGLWVNPQAAGPDYYPTLHLASVGDGYHICNDVQMGSGLYGVYIGDRWLNMVQISNQVLFIPGSNIAFDMLQNPHQLDNGIWAGWGWSYLNLAHPRDYKFWMSFVETYDYQGPINGYIPEHFNWISPDTVASGAYAQAQQVYGSDYGTFATRGNNANGVFGNEYYVKGTLRIEDDLFYVPLPRFPIEKAREYIIAHPQSISQNDMEIYASGIRNNNLSDTLIPTRNLTFTSLYDSSHSHIKIREQINGQEYRYYVDPIYSVGFSNHLGYVDWDFTDPDRREFLESSNGHAFVRPLDTKWVVEPGAGDDYANHPHQYNAEIVPAPDNIIRAPVKNYKFFNYEERDTSHPDFANWDISGKTRYETELQNGALVTYVWFKFNEQPAVLSAAQNHPETYTTAYLEQLQGYIENIHRVTNQNSQKNPSDPVFINHKGGETPDDKDLHLAKIDPGQMVEPLPGFEVGYVPVVISIKHARAYSLNPTEMVKSPSESCTNAAWTDTFHPDIE